MDRKRAHSLHQFAGRLVMVPSRRSLALLALCALACVAVAARAEVTVLRNFTLIDGTGRAPESATALTIDGDRIGWVGPVSKLKMPAGASTVDLTGKYVLPGLIDSHVHLGLVNGIAQDIEFYTRERVEQQLRLYAAYGITSVQVLGTDKDIIFDVRAKLRHDRPDMARVFTSGQGLVYKGSYGGVAHLNQPVATVEEARQAVDAQVAKGVDFIKLWVDDEFGTLPVRMPADISKAIIDRAHEHRLRAIAHVFYLENAKTLVEQGVDGFAHSVRDQPVDQALLTAMKKRGTWQLAATLSREASFTYKKLPFLDDPFFARGVSPATLTALASPERQQKLASGPNFAKYPAVLENAMANTRREVSAGIPYGMGTDSGPTARFAGYFAHWELQLLVQAGLTPMQALTAATGNNAKFMGAKDLGTVAAGKAADLLVLDADPLADIRNTRRIHSVYLAGKSIPTIWSLCVDRPAAECKGTTNP